MGAIDLGLLPAFVAVVETASFSAAAKRLALPKSTVSRAVARLEASLGVRLLHRTTRHVAATTAGRALYDRAAPMVASLQRSVAAVPDLAEEPAGLLRVTAATDFGAAVLAELVARFCARYPRIEVALSLTNRYVDLVAEGFDVALRITTARLRDSSLHARQVGEVVLLIYASPAYLAAHGTPRSVDDLEAHTWVGFNSWAPVALKGRSGPRKVRPTGRVLCDDHFFLREAVRAGAGLGLLPSFLAQADATAGALVPLLTGHVQTAGKLYLVTPSSRHVPRKVLAFKDFVTEALAQRPLVPRQG